MTAVTPPRRASVRRTAELGERRTEELRARARHHRERRDLYRAKVYGQKPTSSARLRELERACAVSERRFRRSEEESRIEAIRQQENKEL